MKNIKDTYKRLFVGIFSLIVSQLGFAQQSDSIEVSLLTCAPGNEVYSLYGHTALRYHDLRTGEDFAFNYGVFNFNRPFFSLRFLFGLTDYELGVYPFPLFAQEYGRRGSQVTEQVINLTTEEKKALHKALIDNYRPENREYRYNFLYDNCTTRARDMLERNINGRLKYVDGDNRQTYREMVHQYNSKYPWAAFGVDLALGAAADIKIGGRKQQFLPDYMMMDAEKAQILSDGFYRPLVAESRSAVDPGVNVIEDSFPLTPTECALILLTLSLALMAMEWRRKSVFRVWDTILMSLSGLAGIFMLALFCSRHPTTSTNLQLLLINPMPLFFIYRLWRKPQDKLFWKISAILLLLFFAGTCIQNYAEGMVLVGIALMTRCIIHLKP